MVCSITQMTCPSTTADSTHLQQDIGHIRIDCLDQDQKTIDYAENLTKDYSPQFRFILCNAFKYRPGKEYDLIWPAGLCDYLDDKAFFFLLVRLFGNVKSGGIPADNIAAGKEPEGVILFLHARKD